VNRDEVARDVPETARAAVLEAYHEPLVVRDVTVPQELEANAILVRTEAATVCGTDVHLWEGGLSTVLGEALPVIPGHEMVGTIVRFGDGRRRDSVGQPLAVGDRILWTHSSCFACYACTMLNRPALCRNRRYYMCQSPHEYPYLAGGFAQYCYVFPGSQRVRVPDVISDRWASAASCALRTVMSSFDRLLRPLNGFQEVVIQGAGPVGLFATAVARWNGVERVITIGAPAARLDVAKAWGASDVLSIDELPQPDDRAQAVLELTGGRGADVVMEFSGGSTAFKEGIEMTRDAGQYVVCGQTSGAPTDVVASAITRKNLTVSGVWSADASHYWKALQFMVMARNVVSFDRLFSSEYPLERIGDALSRMQRFEETKPVIDPWRNRSEVL
jgi:threonine dehydrogenase-like Zn-dependent dehydrogenase